MLSPFKSSGRKHAVFWIKRSALALEKSLNELYLPLPVYGDEIWPGR